MKVSQHRTQLLLDEERYLWLKRKADDEDRPMAEIVRGLVDKELARQKRRKRLKYSLAYKRLLKLAGKGKKGPADVAEKHDKYLGEWIYRRKVIERR